MTGPEQRSDAARLFVAVPLPEPVLEAMRSWQAAIARDFPPCRLARLDTAHLTVLFLGDVDRAAIGPLAAALEAEAAESGSIRIACRDGGTFPPRGPARVVWLGVDGGPPLSRLHAAATRAARAATDVAIDERTYHPHVTLGRCRSPWPRPVAARFRDAAAGTWAPPFDATEVVLFESRLEPSGAVHAARARVGLGSGEGIDTGEGKEP